jgi:hypothetical protein
MYCRIIKLNIFILVNSEYCKVIALKLFLLVMNNIIYEIQLVYMIIC